MEMHVGVEDEERDDARPILTGIRLGVLDVSICVVLHTAPAPSLEMTGLWVE